MHTFNFFEIFEYFKCTLWFEKYNIASILGSPEMLYILLNQILKHCNKIIQSIFYGKIFFKIDDVHSNYGILKC